MEKTKQIEKIDTTKLSAKDLQIDCYDWLTNSEQILKPFKVVEVEAFRTDYGLQYVLSLTNEHGQFKVSNWRFRPRIRINNILDLKGKTISLYDNGSKKWLLDVIN